MKRACRIRYTMRDGGLKDPEERWPNIQAKLIDAMSRLSSALQAHIR